MIYLYVLHCCNDFTYIYVDNRIISNVSPLYEDGLNDFHGMGGESSNLGYTCNG